MYYHAFIDGRIIETEGRISRLDFPKNLDLVVANCPDRHSAEQCLKYFKITMIAVQLDTLEANNFK